MRMREASDAVLILVLLDDGLGRANGSVINPPTGCLNPCSIG